VTGRPGPSAVCTFIAASTISPLISLICILDFFHRRVRRGSRRLAGTHPHIAYFLCVTRRPQRYERPFYEWISTVHGHGTRSARKSGETWTPNTDKLRRRQNRLRRVQTIWGCGTFGRNRCIGEANLHFQHQEDLQALWPERAALLKQCATQCQG